MSTWIDTLIRSIDQKDTDAVLSYIAEDGSFRYGNGPTSVGKGAVKGAIDGFFDSFKSIRTHTTQVWEVPGAAIIEGYSTFALRNGRQVRLPFCKVLRTNPEGLIREYLVYADVSPLQKQQG